MTTNGQPTERSFWARDLVGFLIQFVDGCFDGFYRDAGLQSVPFVAFPLDVMRVCDVFAADLHDLRAIT